jgi:hypothetical protein
MSNQHSDIPLTWTDNGNEYVAETPYGRAIISEVQETTAKQFNFGTHNYRLRLEYVSGEIENVYHIFDSLSAAEGWAFSSFQSYDSKRREQGELDDLLATLDLCRQSLPPEISKENAQRLNRIEVILKKHFEKLL